MATSLSMAVLRFTAQIGQIDDVPAILGQLHTVVRIAGLNLLGAWCVPPWGKRDDPNAFIVHKHPSLPAQFWADFWVLYLRYRRSFVQELAWQNRGPFTLTDGLRIMKPTGEERWIVRLFNQYGVRDFFYVPNGKWMVVYWASKPLRLDASTRAALQLAANATAARLQAISPRRGKDGADPGLSARQRAVLRLLGQGYAPQEIAEHLAISHGTVKEHLERAQKKLGARTATQAAVEAVRRYAMLAIGCTMAAGAILEIYDICCWDLINTLIERSV